MVLLMALLQDQLIYNLFETRLSGTVIESEYVMVSASMELCISVKICAIGFAKDCVTHIILLVLLMAAGPLQA